MNLILPKISVIVPVYNVQKYIKKCINSIINQTYSNLEIIIVNDGSTDNSGTICEYYTAQDDRIIFINQENQGLSMARNNALDIATGEYIGFVDSDDWIEPDMFFTLYTIAVENDADISMCNFYYTHDSGYKSPFSNETTGIKVLTGVHKITNNIRIANNFVWNKLYRRHLFNETRFPKNKLYEDIFLVYKLIDNANKMVTTSQCEYYYLRRESGITLRKFKLNQFDNTEAYMERYEYISNKYPALEKTCRKQIFLSLLWVLRKAYIWNCIEMYMDKINEFLNLVKKYEFRECGLPIDQEDLLKLLFENLDFYITEMNKEDKVNG